MDIRKEARPSGAQRLFDETRNKAVECFRTFMVQEELSGRDIERLFGIPESTIRSFLRCAHKRGPHKGTFQSLLDLPLDQITRDALLDFIDFDARVRFPRLKARKTVQFPAQKSA